MVKNWVTTQFLSYHKQMENTRFALKPHHGDATGSRVVGRGTSRTNIGKLVERWLQSDAGSTRERPFIEDHL